MERSLSALLPVHNAQSTLAASVDELLEVLPELTRKLEVVIADDGSIDATIEVADDLTTRYPQVIVLRHAQPLGRIGAIRAALERSTGEILLVQDEHCGFCVDEIHRLWRAMDEHEIVLGRVPPPPTSPFQDTTENRSPGGLQMLSRWVAEPLVDSLVDQATLLAALSQQGYIWDEVQLPEHTRRRATLERSVSVHQPIDPTLQRHPWPSRSDSLPTRKHGPNRPNYLARLRNFALEE
ncbi:MAG: glycosyltransferase family 2 protein [Planctomycetes bacterium]|nr:glycosyltransferase family 2 protein [Planctomycetota bacterium]